MRRMRRFFSAAVGLFGVVGCGPLLPGQGSTETGSSSESGGAAQTTGVGVTTGVVAPESTGGSSGESMCPGQGQVCEPWYEEGTAPPGEEHIGYCAGP